MVKSNIAIKSALENVGKDEIFVASQLYRNALYKQMSEAAYYKALQRMCESGELCKVAKGIYHVPKMCKYGIVPLSEEEIIAAYTENATGTVVGYALYNSLSLTTQIPKTTKVLSSSIDGLTKSIGNVVVYKVPLQFSEEITQTIRALEILQNFNSIQDINYSAFLKYAEDFAKNFNAKALEEILSVKSYKKSTISFMKEILRYYRIKNNLDWYLSSLSEYKHPSMEKLYEIARVSR